MLFTNVIFVQDYECQIKSLQEQVERQSIMTESFMSSAMTNSQYGGYIADYASSTDEYGESNSIRSNFISV